MPCSGSGRPLSTLRRYSGMASTVSGVPWARSRTACLGILVLQPKLADHAHHGLHILYRRVWDDAVTKVEDVTRTPIGRAEDFLDSQFQHFKGREERDRIEIALHRMVVSLLAPADVERLTPVKADDISSRRRHLGKQTGSLDAEVNDRDTHGLHSLYKALRSFECVVTVVAEAERTDPAIKY